MNFSRRSLIQLICAFATVTSLLGQSGRPERLFETRVDDGAVLIERSNITNSKTHEHLIWVHADNTRDEISTIPGWSIEAAFGKGNELAMVRANVGGMLEYWRFERRGSRWELSAKAVLGSDPLLDRVEFTGLDSFTFHTRGKSPGTFKMTDEPRSGDPLYRQVLKNGILHTTPGIWIGNELHPGPRGGTSSTVTNPALRPVQAQASKALEAKPTLPAPSEEPTSSTPWSIIVVLIVAATGLLWLLLKKRK